MASSPNPTRRPVDIDAKDGVVGPWSLFFRYLNMPSLPSLPSPLFCFLPSDLYEFALFEKNVRYSLKNRTTFFANSAPTSLDP